MFLTLYIIQNAVRKRGKLKDQWLSTLTEHLFGLSNSLWTFPAGSFINELNKFLASTHLYLYEDPVFKFWKLYLDSFGEPTETFKWTHMSESIKLYCWRHHFTIYISPGKFLLGSQSDFPSGSNVLLTFYFSFFFFSFFWFAWICLLVCFCFWQSKSVTLSVPCQTSG